MQDSKPVNVKVDHLSTHNTQQWADRLQDAIDGDLGANDLAALSEHLSGCDACSSDYRALHALNAALTSQIAAPPLAPNFDAMVYARISTLAPPSLAHARELEQQAHRVRIANLQRDWRSFWRFNLGNLLGSGAVFVAIFSTLAAVQEAQPVRQLLQGSAITSPLILIAAVLAVTCALRVSERTS
jgi:anti-sigma factor RsiW